jgi:predicted transcriptional regulator of viral defense system
MGTHARARDELRAISRAAKERLLTVAVAAETWGVPARTAATRLASLAARGWIARVRRGLYYVLPVQAGTDVVAEDPWVLADALFAPCYIGGWSAAEHWGLTEQIFRSTFVFTAANIRRREQVALGTTFHLTRVPRARVESVSTVWRGGVRVCVASPERTLVDALADPARVGGFRHLAEIFLAYRESPHASEATLAAELRANGNGAAHKRAGLLAEHLWPTAGTLTRQAIAGRTAGVVRLDPAVRRRGRMSRRWGLWINVALPAGGARP